MDSKRVAARFLTASDIKIIDVDFESDQEPRDDYDPDFITPVEIVVDLSGMALTRLFGKQRRVLGAFLTKLSEKQAISYFAHGGRKVAPVLEAAKPKIKDLITYFAMDEFDRGVRNLKMDFSDNDHYWEAKIDPRKQIIRYRVVVDVLGEWD